jgi:predicted RNase H-like nuclease (RuvC/YqgF family)
MTESIWLAIIAALLGGGGLGAVIVNAIANRKKVAADCVAIVTKNYVHIIEELKESSAKLEIKVSALEEQLEVMRDGLEERETTIRALKEKNTELMSDIEKMQSAIKKRDDRIRTLERNVSDRDERIKSLEDQVKDLSKRLDQINTGGC